VRKPRELGWEQSVSDSDSVTTVRMVARILRPSFLAMGRGPGVSAEAGRAFWPSAAEAVVKHKTRR
jgi:hypothetical protein